MVLNPDKCNFILFDVKDELQTDLVSNVTVKNSKEEKVPGITLDSELDFSMHLTSIIEKANIKLNALTRVRKYVSRVKGPPNILFYKFSI